MDLFYSVLSSVNIDMRYKIICMSVTTGSCKMAIIEIILVLGEIKLRLVQFTSSATEITHFLVLTLVTKYII